MGTTDRRASYLCVDGNTYERPGRRLSHDYCSDRKAQRVATRAFGWRSARSRTDRTAPEQHHPGQARTAIGTAEACLGLHHPCRTEHGVGSARSRRSSSCHPITVDQPGVAARIAEKKTGLFVPLKELT